MKKMNNEESEGIDQNDGEAFEELTQDNALMGSGEGYTLDADEAKKRIIERRNKLIEHNFIENPNSTNGNKESQDVSAEYPIKEGQRRTPKGSDNSGQPKSVLQ